MIAFARREDFSKLMTFGAPESGTSNNVRIPSIVVLGADALLAALPATPIQLAHACMLAGYQNVVPASWGDELIAAASLRALRHHGQLPAIQCSCPYVAHRLLAVGTDLRPFLLSFVAPPVALARYLRALYAPRKLRITYVGRCPGAADESIDARLTPEEMLAIFADHQIAIEHQPDYFDSVIPPDRRRYRSQPGGLPTAEMLWSADSNGAVAARSLIELFSDELPVELAQHLLAGKPSLIDVAPALGCVCSGATVEVDAMHARARVTELEPPRATHPVLDETVVTETSLSLPASPRSAIDLVSMPPSAVTTPVTSTPNEVADPSADTSDQLARLATHEIEDTLTVHGPQGGRRFSPARGVARLTGVALPTARDADGRQLPRTYVARRRPATRLNRATPADSIAPIAPASEEAPAPASAAQSAQEVPPPQSAGPTDASHVSPVPEMVPPIPSPPIEIAPTVVATGAEVAETVVTRRPTTMRRVEEERDNNPRFAERAVTLPVARLSDGRPREDTPPQHSGDRPIVQVLTLGLLFSMIVLVSVAVGVLVGRWMTQR